MNTIDKDVTGYSLAIYDNGLRLTCRECGTRSLAISQHNLQRMEAKPSPKMKATEQKEITKRNAFVDSTLTFFVISQYQLRYRNLKLAVST